MDSVASSLSRSSSASKQKEAEKYIKFFCIKALQCVIQSRIGTCNKTKCNPSAKGVDWFNVSLPSGDAALQLQAKINDLFRTAIPGLSKPACADIILKTAEGSYTVLETWQITIQISKEGLVENNFSVYNRLSVLLKSVISCSRLLPSYHLSRKNESDFFLFGRVHTELYPLHHFELHNTMNVGSVMTLAGVVNVKVIYRNKTWLSGSIHPHTYKIENVDSLFMLTTDRTNEEMLFQSADMVEKEIAQAVIENVSPNVDTKISLMKEKDTKSSDGLTYGHSNAEIAGKQIICSGPSVGHIDENSRPIAAFVELSENITTIPAFDLPNLSDVPPFMSLFKNDDSVVRQIKEDTSESIKKHLDEPQMSHPDLANNKIPSTARTPETVGCEDDFVLVELRPAFCTDDDSGGSLYRLCQSPAVLDMFASLEKEDKEGENIDIDTMLKMYQDELKDFQEFFKCLNS